MKRTTYSKYRRMLDGIRKRLIRDMEGQIRICRDAAGEKTSESIDFANNSYGEDMAATMAEMEHRELKEIEGALERIKAGEYGKCKRCGKRIPKARLEALPFATLCLECKTAEEQDDEGADRDTHYFAGGTFTASNEDPDDSRIRDVLRDIELNELSME
ncbi:MAG TPA: TraR/DksA C4-type zinc finger protein [Candidatus Brocadiia bacterium]|nr:TraR/DksA C4-type zinc finger protein [Candidatus Brocadiia bacterium]